MEGNLGNKMSKKKKNTNKSRVETLYQQLREAGSCAMGVDLYLRNRKSILEAWEKCNEPRYLLGIWLWAAICDQKQVDDIFWAVRQAMFDVLNERFQEAYNYLQAGPKPISDLADDIIHDEENFPDPDQALYTLQEVRRTYNEFIDDIENPRVARRVPALDDLWACLDTSFYVEVSDDAEWVLRFDGGKPLCDAIRGYLNPPDQSYFDETWEIYCEARKQSGVPVTSESLNSWG